MKDLMFLFLFLPVIGLANDNELKICLTGSTEKALPKYGEAFVNGAMMAFNELKSSEKKKARLEIHYYDSNPLAPLTKIEDMKRVKCDAIIGFSTGNDLLTIEDNLKINPIFTLSIYGDPQDRFSETSYLRTMQPSAEDLVGFLFDKLNLKIRKMDRVLVVTASDRSEMVSYRDAYNKKLNQIGASVTNVQVVEQTHDLQEFNKIIKDGSKFDYMVFLTRSLIAAEMSDIAHKYSKPIILGTKYFGSAELPAFYNFLKNKNIEAYFSRQNCSCDPDPAYQKARLNYINIFNVKPMAISMDAYDATKFVLLGLQSKKLDAHSVLEFLNSITDFKGVTSLKIEKDLKLTSSKRFIMKIDEKGYSVQ